MQQKNRYISPRIELVKLDNEISLALESSSPPTKSNETNNVQTPDYFNTNPYRSTLG